MAMGVVVVDLPLSLEAEGEDCEDGGEGEEALVT